MRYRLRKALLVVAVLLGGAATLQAALVASFSLNAPTSHRLPVGELSPATSEAVTFVAISDVHAHPGVLFAAYDEVRQSHADALLIGGDLVNRNSEFDFQYGALLLEKAPPVPVFLAIGNHEGFDRSDHVTRERFERFFGPPVSWISFKGVLVVSIDTADYGFSEEQARAVDVLLAERRPKARHAILLTHVMPRFETPSIDKRGNVKHLGVPESERVWRLCEKHRVDLVLGGHFHGYSSETRGGTVYVMSGGGGGALDGPNEFYHYLRVRFADGKVTHEVIHVDDPFGLEWLRYELLRYGYAVLGGLAAAFGVSLLARRLLRSA